MAHQAISYQTLDDVPRAIEAGQRAIAAAEGLDDLGAHVAANVDLGTLYSGIGDYRQGFPYHLRVARWLEGDLARERFDMNVYPGVYAPAQAGRALGLLGRFDEAFPLLEQASRTADAIGQPTSISNAAWCTGVVYVARGDVARAIPVLERGADIAERWDVVGNLVSIGLVLGVAYSLAGRVDEATLTVERGTARLASMQATGSPVPSDAGRRHAEAYFLAGRVREAEQLVLPALDHMRATRRYTGEADCLWLLGEIEARRDEPDFALAEAHLREGLALAEEHELRPRQAQCHLALGKLYRRLGRLDEAHAELSTAVAMLREMGMTFWLPEAEGELTATTASQSAEQVG
jgi:tetratricopeptide (TPR) repeat protein